MAKHKIPYQFSDESENSYRLAILTSGIDLSRFKANPIVLKNHNPDMPVGQAEDLSVNDKKFSGVIVIDDEGDPDLEKLVRDINKGLWKGTSLQLDFNFGNVQVGVDGFPPEMPVVVKSELIEISVTPIPSNKNSLKLSCNGEMISPEAMSIKLNAIKKNNQNQNPMSKLTLMAAALTLSAAATEDEVLTKIQSLVNENKTLSEKLQKVESDKADALKLSATKLVEDAVTANKITAEQKEHYLKLAHADLDSTRAILDKVTPYKSATAQLSTAGTPGATDEDPTAKYTFKDFQEKAPKLLLAMKKDNPERWRKLFNSQYGADKK